MAVPHDLKVARGEASTVWPCMDPELASGLVARAARPDYPRFEAQLRSSGYCARPVLLRGRVKTYDREGRQRRWSTDSEPDAVLRKACGNRREAVCPPCAERYSGDAYSTRFKALREAREQHVHQRLVTRSGDAMQRAIAGATERVSSLRYAGLGHLTAADAFLAASAAARAREQRKAAREEGVFSRGALKSTVPAGCRDEGW